MAYYGFFERENPNSHTTDEWKLAFPFNQKYVHASNPEIEFETVFHTWKQPTQEHIDAFKPVEYSVGNQVWYNDSGIPDHAKGNYHKPYKYNNLKNRFFSMKESFELAKKRKSDLIFMNRFDCFFKFSPRLKELNFKENTIYAANWNPVKNWSIVDHYYIAIPEMMEKFVNSGCELLTEKMFFSDSPYAAWLHDNAKYENKIDKFDWVSSHKVVRWFLQAIDAEYIPYGFQDQNTFVIRQIERYGLKL